MLEFLCGGRKQIQFRAGTLRETDFVKAPTRDGC
jgi:hypothetical protein